MSHGVGKEGSVCRGVDGTEVVLQGVDGRKAVLRGVDGREALLWGAWTGGKHVLQGTGGKHCCGEWAGGKCSCRRVERQSSMCCGGGMVMHIWGFGQGQLQEEKDWPNH